jgi:glycosyltransferase involved in cell wall biosynthesis
LILFVGRFDRIKGGDLVLKAFSLALAQRPNLRLLFVGPDVGVKGEDGLPMSFPEFIRREIPAPARARIQFAGQLKRPQVEELRTKAHATIVGSRYETFGNVVIEAMMFGCPIVATRVGGIMEIITDSRNGLLAPVDAVALATRLTQILDNPELSVRLGHQAAVDCAKKFDPRLIGSQTIDFYTKVIDEWRANPRSCPAV